MLSLAAGKWGCAGCLQDGREVAVKVFKGETSPDGQAADEIAVTCHVEHRNLSRLELHAHAQDEVPR